MTGPIRMRRRRLVLSGAAALASRPALAQPSERAATLVLAVDIGDARTFDPARAVAYTVPLTLRACYDTLVTFAPGRYAAVVPCLAASWARTPDGGGWRFTLRPDATFASGNRVRPADCAFSINRVLAADAPPAHFTDAIAAAEVSGDDTVDVKLTSPDRPVLGALAAPCFAILEQAALEARGVPAGTGAENEVLWLDGHSAGSGPYVLRGWVPQRWIEMEASTASWRGTPPFRRVRVVGLSDSAAQLRALRRGEADAAFNLSPADLDQARSQDGLRVETVQSLDLAYLLLTADAARNPALAKRAARQAIGRAIDFDDLIGRLLGGKAVRPASFLPVGLPGSEPGGTAAFGFGQDLDAARTLLAEAGLPGGFEFELSYIDGAIAGLDWATLARKLRDDLGRVGIVARPRAMPPRAWQDAFAGGKLQAALGFWTSPVVESAVWASAALDRLAPRAGLAVPTGLAELVAHAGTEADPAVAWADYQRTMVNLASVIVLFQPAYQVAMRAAVGTLPLTAAGWMADVAAAAPPPGKGRGGG